MLCSTYSCCDTSVESTKWICVERVSLNEWISNAGHFLLYLTNRNQTQTEKVMPNLHMGALSRRNFWTGDMSTLSAKLEDLISTLEYVYSIQCSCMYLRKKCFFPTVLHGDGKLPRPLARWRRAPEILWQVRWAEAASKKLHLQTMRLRSHA
jgi:hypothetical protein